jgi:hypothetical protein
MKRALSALVLVAMFASPVSQAFAENLPAREDIRCLIVGLKLGVAPDQQQRAAGNLLAWYYFGRLERNSASSIQSAALRELKSMTASDFDSESLRCASVLRDKSLIMQEVEHALSQHN